ncbi:hypothetical protein QE152_g37892 [Popillia japonica]|uniref:Uncharacterized protein n=1 Tax=Popillia japonica TaxID=7064 RepID=A0AAW1I8X3_POPJA
MQENSVKQLRNGREREVLERCKEYGCIYNTIVDGNESEEDGADEKGTGDENHLTGRQLRAQTVATLYSNAGVTD